MRRLPAVAGLAALAFAAGAPAAQAGTCALCREVLARSGNQGLVDGFYWSILLIGSVPLLVLTAAGIAIWRSLRRR